MYKNKRQLNPTYIRVVATTKCNLNCAYCHREGDDINGGQLEKELLKNCLSIAVDKGVQKIKFLGGEPLMRNDLPDIISYLRHKSKHLDLSVITAGVLPTRLVDRAFSAGLDRINISVHGFLQRAMSSRVPKNANVSKFHERRTRFIEQVIKYQRPCKINYVYSGVEDESDINLLLDWAKKLPVTINLLNNLNNLKIDSESIKSVLIKLRGNPKYQKICLDPNSLETTDLFWNDGLKVKLKHKKLGDLEAYTSCINCKKKEFCREGIYALRLMHSGNLQLCMDRSDIYLPLAKIIKNNGFKIAEKKWDLFFKKMMNNESNYFSHYRTS